MIRLEINGWDAHIGFSAAHILPAHDKCSRLHGHNYAVHARIEGTEDEQGFVFDFIPLKAILRNITEELDHKIILPSSSNNGGEDRVELTVKGKSYVFPREDCLFLDIERTTAEELAAYILRCLLDELKVPENVNSIEIGVDESRGQGAWVKKELR